jgi:hypothetical protein
MATSSFNGIGDGNEQAVKERQPHTTARFRHEAQVKSSMYASKTIKRYWRDAYATF